jgi:hypothetical protein
MRLSNEQKWKTINLLIFYNPYLYQKRNENSYIWISLKDYHYLTATLILMVVDKLSKYAHFVVTMFIYTTLHVA